MSIWRRSYDAVSRDAIARAERAIRPYIRRNAGPRGRRGSLSSSRYSMPGRSRRAGAFANLLSREIPPAGRRRAASGGNHGAAVAYAAMTLGRSRGHLRADRFVAGEDRANREFTVRASSSAATGIPMRTTRASFTSPRPVVAWPCTLFDSVRDARRDRERSRWSWREQLPELDTLLVAVGGGGLIVHRGVYENRVKVVAVEPEGAADVTPTRWPRWRTAGGCSGRQHRRATRSPRARRRADVPDSAQRFIDGVVLVSDDDIIDARGHALGPDARRYRAGRRSSVRSSSLEQISSGTRRTGRRRH